MQIDPATSTLLKLFRSQRGLTQEVFAQQLHIARDTLKRWERGDPISHPYILAMALLYLGSNPANGHKGKPKKPLTDLRQHKGVSDAWRTAQPGDEIDCSHCGARWRMEPYKKGKETGWHYPMIAEGDGSCLDQDQNVC